MCGALVGEEVGQVDMGHFPVEPKYSMVLSNSYH